MQSWLLPGWPYRLEAGLQTGSLPPARELELLGPIDGTGAYHLFQAGELVAVASNREQVANGLDSWFHHLLAEHSEQIFVHAGVVQWKGLRLVFPARSFSGKSTLIKALCKAGANYFSDEFAVIDPLNGMVAPFPRRLSLRPSGRIEPQALGWSEQLEPGLADLVFCLTYQAGAQALELEPISRGVACLGFFENTVAAKRFGASALAVFQKSVAHSRCFRGVRAEATQAAESILELAQSH
ncbi:hypothetical protein JST97_07570 [bacterium]|nr:hypothetical protein [bacterium]